MNFQTGSTLIKVKSNAESSNWSFLHSLWPVLRYHLSTSSIMFHEISFYIHHNIVTYNLIWMFWSQLQVGPSLLKIIEVDVLWAPPYNLIMWNPTSIVWNPTFIHLSKLFLFNFTRMKEQLQLVWHVQIQLCKPLNTNIIMTCQKKCKKCVNRSLKWKISLNIMKSFRALCSGKMYNVRFNEVICMI